MTLYRVTWDIDIEAETALKAAQRALEVQRDPESVATVFTVQAHGPEAVQVDLTPSEDLPDGWEEATPLERAAGFSPYQNRLTGEQTEEIADSALPRANQAPGPP